MADIYVAICGVDRDYYGPLTAYGTFTSEEAGYKWLQDYHFYEDKEGRIQCENYNAPASHVVEKVIEVTSRIDI